MRSALVLVLLGLACRAQDLPLTGISHVNFRVSDLEKSRAFYTGILGYPQAFFTGRNGAVGTAYLKVNDEQYIEISPGLREGENQRLTHISFVTTDIEKLHAALTARGLQPTALRPPGGDGTRGIRITDPFGFPLEFTEYLPGSEHAKARGKFEDPQRISIHLLHAGIPVPREKMDTAMAYYRDKLGFTEFWRGGRKDGAVDYINLRTPGARGDYIELMIYDGTPTREELGTMQHVALEVPDVQQGFQTAVERGAPEEKSKPKIGRNGKWQLNLYDPDGSRTELMEPKASADANRLAADLQALRGTERLSDAQYKRIQTEYLEWIDARVGAGKTVDTMNTELRAQGLFSDWKDSVDENFKTHAGYLEPLSVRDLHAAGDILVIVAQMYQGALCSLDDTIVLYQRTPPRRIGQINAESGKYAHYLSGLDVGEKLASGARLIASGWTFSNCTSTWNGKTIRIDRLRETSVENILTRDLWAQDRFPEENVSARLQGVIVSFFYQGGIGDAELLSVPSIARYRVLAGGAIREAPVALTRAGFIREWLDMDDAEASRWSEPAALKARTPAAAAIKKNGIAWQGVSQCLAPIWEVAIRPNDTQSLYVFHISGARATALRMLAVTNKLTPGCTAIDIKSNLNSVGAELPW